MASLFSESFESGTNGTTITTANSAFTNLVQAGWTFSNAHVVTGYGSMAGRCTASGTTSIANKGAAAWTSAPVVYADLPIYVETLPASDTTICEFRNGSTVVSDLRLTASGAVKLRNPAFTAVATSATGLASAGKMARLQVKFDATAGKLQLRVFSGSNVAGSIPDYDSGLVSVSGLSATTAFQVGIVSSATATLDYGAVAFDNAAFPGPTGNMPPTCSASASASTVNPGVTVTLSGTDSDSDGTIASRSWTQTSGTAVTLSGASTATATFTAPSVSGGTTLGFSYTVTDNLGATATSTVSVTVTSSSASIAVRGSAQNVNTGTSATTTVVVPSATVVGDKLVAFFFDGSGASLTDTFTTAGWQAVNASAVGSSIGLHVWQKTAVAGDASSTLTVTSSVDGVSSYKRTFVVVAMAGARMGNTGGALETAAGTAHTAPAETAVSASAWVLNAFADRGSPGSTGFTLPGNLTALQSYAHAGGAAVTSVVAYDDLVGSGSVGGNTATGTLSTASAAMATVVLEPGAGLNPPPTVNAGADQVGIEPWSTVTVGGTDTAQGAATVASTLWQQISGADVTGSLSSTSTSSVTFTAPPTIPGATLVLQKTVTDSTGVSNSDQVQVVVLPVTERVVIGGVETPMRVFRVAP